jgi:hypothetical protein
MIDHMCIHSPICAEMRDKCPSKCRQIQYGNDITNFKLHFQNYLGLPIPYNARVLLGDSNRFEVTL